MRRTLILASAGLCLAACASPGGGSAAGGGGSRRTADSRVRSFLGRTPPELTADARWLNAPPSSLAALRGRVVYVQFAFPT